MEKLPVSVIRSFIALDLSPDVLRCLETVQRQLVMHLPGSAVRWVPVQNIHLTLKFLGDVSTVNLNVLYEILQREAEKVPAFEIQIGGVGAFPSPKRPRVIWAGVQAPAELFTIQRAIDFETTRLGYSGDSASGHPERAFSPHLTLGRTARGATPDEIHQISSMLENAQSAERWGCRIQAVHFYRSDLDPRGASYTRLFSANFA